MGIARPGREGQGVPTRMDSGEFIQWAAGGLILMRWAGQAWLDRLNQGHVRAQGGRVPEGLASVIDPETGRRSAEYTLARARLGQVDEAWSTAVLIAVLFSGILPWTWEHWVAGRAGSTAGAALWLIGVGFALSIPSIPLEWWAQFRLEERFGFNTTTPATWVADRLKGGTLAIALGFPLLWVVLRLFEAAGTRWWLWAWAFLSGFQLILMVVAPVLILPLFNRFTPLPEGPLRDRLMHLAERTGFAARTIQVVDGSRRSRHANAYFTGIGRYRKIALYDTLIEQLSPGELEAVLAHEIGHHRLGHIPRTLAASLGFSLAGFAALGWLGGKPEFPAAFGFSPDPGAAPVLLLFALISGTVSFWISPLFNLLSRKHEYEADAFARDAVGSPAPLVSALRKLAEKNLTNLHPHPWHSAFHHSHPTLLEREAALGKPGPTGRPHRQS